MQKFRLFIVFDALLKFILLFFLNLIWTLYFIPIKWLCLLVSTASSVLILFIFHIIKSKLNHKKKIKTDELKYIDDIKNTFIFMSNQDVLIFFEKLLKTKHNVKINENYLLVNKENPSVLYPIFKNKIFDIDDLIDIANNFKSTKYEKLIILCTEYSLDSINQLNNFEQKIVLLNYKEMYERLLKKYNFYPEIRKTNNEKPTKTFKQFLPVIFDKKRTRSYFVSSLFIFISSYFTIYRIYYLIFSSILLIFAFLCRFDFKFKVTKQNTSLF